MVRCRSHPARGGICAELDHGEALAAKLEEARETRRDERGQGEQQTQNGRWKGMGIKGRKVKAEGRGYGQRGREEQKRKWTGRRKRTRNEKGNKEMETDNKKSMLQRDVVSGIVCKQRET